MRKEEMQLHAIIDNLAVSVVDLEDLVEKYYKSGLERGMAIGDVVPGDEIEDRLDEEWQNSSAKRELYEEK